MENYAATMPDATGNFHFGSLQSSVRGNGWVFPLAFRVCAGS